MLHSESQVEIVAPKYEAAARDSTCPGLNVNLLKGKMCQQNLKEASFKNNSIQNEHFGNGLAILCVLDLDSSLNCAHKPAKTGNPQRKTQKSNEIYLRRP